MFCSSLVPRADYEKPMSQAQCLGEKSHLLIWVFITAFFQKGEKLAI